MTRSGFCERGPPSTARASPAESLPSTTSWFSPIPSMRFTSRTSSDRASSGEALCENALREQSGLSLRSLSEEPFPTCPITNPISQPSTKIRGASPEISQPSAGCLPVTLMRCARDAPCSPRSSTAPHCAASSCITSRSPRSQRSSSLICREEPPADAPVGLGESNGPRRRSKSSPLPLRGGGSHEEDESTDPAQACEADQRPPRLLTASPAESLHSSPATPERSSYRKSTSFRGISSESSIKAASEETFSLEQRGQLRDVAASERASAEKTSPALAAVISVHSTKEFFFWRAPEGHLTYKLPVTSYGETSFSRLLAPDDVAEGGIAANNEVVAASVLPTNLPVVTYRTTN